MYQLINHFRFSIRITTLKTTAKVETPALTPHTPYSSICLSWSSLNWPSLPDLTLRISSVGSRNRYSCKMECGICRGVPVPSTLGALIHRTANFRRLMYTVSHLTTKRPLLGHHTSYPKKIKTKIYKGKFVDSWIHEVKLSPSIFISKINVIKKEIVCIRDAC